LDNVFDLVPSCFVLKINEVVCCVSCGGIGDRERVCGLNKWFKLLESNDIVNVGFGGEKWDIDQCIRLENLRACGNWRSHDCEAMKGKGRGSML